MPVLIRFCGLLITSILLCGQNYPAPPFNPPAGHPRVYFRAKDVPQLLTNSTKKQNSAAWQTQLKNLEFGTDGLLPKPADKKTNADSAILAVIESYAFDYALRGDAGNGRKAIAAMRNYGRTVVFPGSDYNNGGQAIFTIAIVYDWCFPLLTAEDRDALYQAMLAIAPHLEVGWPPVKQGNVTGHGPEGQLMRDLMSAAIAMYDEHPELYRVIAGRFFSGMIEPRKFMYQARMHTQGSHYSNYRGQWEMLTTWIFDRMGFPRVFGQDQQHFPYWAIYARRPDGQVLRDGDTHINNIAPGRYYTEPGRLMFLAANYFSDPYLMNEALREIPDLAPQRPYRNQSLNAVEILVFNNPSLDPRPFDELPLTEYFPSPKGAMIARTGWSDGAGSPAVVAEMKINEWYFGNHEHLDAGAFQIYYRGALATDSGYYQAALDVTDSSENSGSSGYASAHDFNYNKRSIAHNTINVYDPNEKFETRRWKDHPLANDGGQRLPNGWNEPQEQAQFMDPANGYRIAEVLGHGFGPDAKQPDYTYLKGDLAKAYSSKIKAYERCFVFLNLKQAAHPAALLVFDRVMSSDPKFHKAWLLHGLEQPSIATNHVVFKDTRPGYTGKLTLDALLPEASDTAITSIGGPGKEAWVDGVNYKALTRPTGNNEGGGWRIEIALKTKRETDYFLNVLQMGDHTPDVPALPVHSIQSDSHAGVRLADRVVLFSRDRRRAVAPVAFRFAGEGRPKILVDGLEAGRWTIERAGKPAGVATVAQADGIAYFEGEPGAYRLIPITTGSR